MATPKELYYEKRAGILIRNLENRHFEACYCANKEEALRRILEMIPDGSSIGWGGTLTCQQLGLMEALHAGNYNCMDRDRCETPEAREKLQREMFFADWFITGANALSLDGQMVNIDGTGNRVAPIVYGPRNVLVVAGMNKVSDSLEDALSRARTIAAPMNKQRFPNQTPCEVTGTCGDCKTEGCICNQILVTRHCRPAGRIKFILIGEDLGM
ncbi:MAG: lactate utilization protein [Oscillospiraceae bacterium]|nr:lactate utilization protein [Oscillospiraceae bacterium]